MQDFDGQLARACLDGINPVLASSHQHTYLDVVPAVVEAVAAVAARDAAGGESVAAADYEVVRDRVADAHGKKTSQRDLDRLLLGPDGYAVLVPGPVDPARLRVTSARADLPVSAMLPGSVMLAAARDDVRRLRRRIAHNHLLLFPEVLALLPLFATPQPKAIVRQRADQFVFGRRLNDTSATFVANECEALRLVVPARGADDDRLELPARLPAPAVAYAVVAAYLKATGHRVDVGVAASDVAVPLAYLGLARDWLFDPAWQADLRDGGGLLRLEMGDAQVRVTEEAFVWLAANRLVEPSDVGRVLVARRAHAAARAVRDPIERRMASKSFGSPPANRDDYLSAFG